MHYRFGGDRARHQRHQAFAGELIEYSQYPHRLTPFGTVLSEIIAPHLIRMFSTALHLARFAVVALKGFTARLLQTFPSPDAFNPFVIDRLPIPLHQGGDVAVAMLRKLIGIGS